MIHETSIISDGAIIEPGAQIGPYCIIGSNVKIGKGVKLHAHVCVDGYTEIGEDTVIFPFACIGYQPQDMKYKGEDSRLIIGKRNIIREHVTIHPGTAADNMLTRIGDDCLIMVGVHIAHDCVIGNNVIMANNSVLAGHVVIGEGVRLGGMTAYQQRVRIGNHAMIGGGSLVAKDVIPYGLVFGERAKLQGLNIVGMRRKGVTNKEIELLQRAYEGLFGGPHHLTFQEKMSKVEKELGHSKFLAELLDFIKDNNKNGICIPDDKE
jgi:UDP-N-acetylglucosamine acyltransferase